MKEVIDEVPETRADARRGREEVGVGGITGPPWCVFCRTALRAYNRCVKRRTFRVNRRTLRTPGTLHPTEARLVRRLGGSGALAPLLDSGREYRLTREKEPSERDMKRRRTGLGQGEYGSLLKWMTPGDSGTSVTPVSFLAWLPSVAPIEELYRVDFEERIGGGTSRTEGESSCESQMTEKWNEEIFGTGGRGLNMSLLREDEGEGRFYEEGIR